jgi:hypothetical protein
MIRRIAMKSKWIGLISFLVLVAITLSCSLIDGATEEPQTTEEPDSVIQDISEPRVIEGPDGVFLDIAGGALEGNVDPKIENLGEGEPFPANQPFKNYSDLFLISFGGADQLGEITMTVPLDGGANKLSAQASQVLLAWTEPERGYPSVVGVIEEQGKATFPVVGEGRYQVISLPSSEALRAFLLEPLSVPSYPQMTPAWCSLTAMTNLVQFHQGAWPAGGLGSVWGETSNWYLAGNAGLAYNKGLFFHWVLEHGGYPVPEDVKQSFFTPEHDVIIWNWYGAQYTFEIDGKMVTIPNLDFADALFEAFKAYVEFQVWGVINDPRPVAWGSGLEGHSRTITGSDGENIYYNETGWGEPNLQRGWEEYRQMIMDSLIMNEVVPPGGNVAIEIIDTVILHAPPRPENERRGVLWLRPDTENLIGAVNQYHDAESDASQPDTRWIWDGNFGHSYGYYYQDQTGDLPHDQVLGSRFQAHTPTSEIRLRYTVLNISKGEFTYRVDSELFTEAGDLIQLVSQSHNTLGPKAAQESAPKETIQLVDLSPGLYYIRFSLYQGAYLQDVKYVYFRVDPPELNLEFPAGIINKNTFCRKGPSKAFQVETGFPPGVVLELVGVNIERTWAKIQAEANNTIFQCWISLDNMDAFGLEEVPPLQSPPTPHSCTAYENEGECIEAGCTWHFTLMGTGYCGE